MEDVLGIQKILELDSNLNLASPSDLAELAENGQRLHFKKGEFVFRAGDDPDFFYIVEDGRVVLSKESPSGKLFTYMIAVKGLPLNSIACFKSRPRFFSAASQRGDRDRHPQSDLQPVGAHAPRRGCWYPGDSG